MMRGLGMRKSHLMVAALVDLIMVSFIGLMLTRLPEWL
jgi:hypothetical protein